MINNLTNLFDACELNKNQRFSTCGLSLPQYHLQNALWLASLGYYVFPVSGQKIPFKGFRWKEFSTKDTKVLIEYWQKYPYGRIAIDCEKSGITVVDVDNKPERNKHGLKILADCLNNWGDFAQNASVIISPSGGLHIYFKDSEKPLMRCYANCIDIQRPHYVLAPTSLNAQNGLYKIYNNFLAQADLPQLPDEWLTQLAIKSEIKANKTFKPIKKKVLDIDVAPLYEKCSFFKHCIEEAEELPEYLWFEFAKFLSCVVNGEELFHKYSENYPNYNYAETQSKFENAKSIISAVEQSENYSMAAMNVTKIIKRRNKMTKLVKDTSENKAEDKKQSKQKEVNNPLDLLKRTYQEFALAELEK